MKRPNIKIMLRSMQKRRNRTTLPVSMRKNAGEIFYQQSKKSGMTTPLHEEIRIREWTNWAIIDNAFPYSAVFKVHHMLIPKRPVPQSELTTAEKLELEEILGDIGQEYDCYIVNFTSKQSIRNHYHIHLMIYKEKRSDLRF